MYKLICLEGAAVVLTVLLQLMSAHGSIVYGSPTDQHTAYGSPTWSWTDCSESYMELKCMMSLLYYNYCLQHHLTVLHC